MPSDKLPLNAAQITEAASSIWAAKGYRGSSLEDVAAVFGVTRQAIYHYYRDKESVLESVFSELFDKLEFAVKSARVSVTNQPDQFMAMYRAYLEVLASHRDAASIVMQELGSLSGKRSDLYRARRRELHALFVDSYHDGVESGVLVPTPADIAVPLLLGAANWTYVWFTPQRAVTISELSDSMEQIIRGGLSVGSGMVADATSP